jgi:preprotein translocase subunit YajC
MDVIAYIAQQSAAPETPAASGGGPAPSASPFGDWTFLIITGGLFLFMYFFIIRPQRRDEKKKKEMLTQLKKGDQVVTTSGLLATVASVKEETVILNVGDGTRIEFLRSAISSVRNPSSTTGKPEEKAEEKNRARSK